MAADNTDLMVRFFQKTHDDERLLRSRHPQISVMLQSGGNMPVAVLQNYMIARNECQERIGFTSNLMRQHADPALGTTTPAPDDPRLQLPLFASVPPVAAPGLGGIASVADLMALAPTTMVSAKDIAIVSTGGMVLSPGQAPAPSGALGLAPLIAVIVVAGIYIGGKAIVAIVKALTQEDVKLAEQKVELSRQANFAKVWDTAAGLVAQCVGVSPTPDRISKCWEDVSKRFPAIVKAIPEHKFSTGGFGFLSTIGLLVAIGATVLVGFWGYGKIQEARERREHKAERAEDREDRRTAALQPGMAGARRRRRRA